MNLDEWRRKWDWAELNDAEIARASGASRERVRQVREALGLGRPRSFHRRRGTALEKISGMRSSGRTLGEVAAAAGCGVGYAKSLLRKLGREWKRGPDGRRRCKYAWESVTASQWAGMTDKEVAAKLGVGNPGVVMQWRRRHGILKNPRS